MLIEIYGKNTKYADCLKYANGKTGGVQIIKRAKGGGFAWSGRWRCKDRGCPVCAIVREQKNADKLQQILHHPDNENTSVLFITLTQERLKQSLTEGLKTQSSMRSELNRSLMKKKEWGFKGFITSVEYTYRLYDGAVHPHAHIAGLFDKEIIADNHSHRTVEDILQEISEYIVRRWVQLAKKYEVYATQAGQKVIPIRLGSRDALGAYLLKFAQELASGSTKESQARGIYTYAGLLNRYALSKCKSTARAIKQINEEIKYKRTFTIAKNLKVYLEEEEYEVEEKDIVVDVPLAVFGAIAKHGVQDKIMLMYNGHYSLCEDIDVWFAVFEELCKRFTTGYETKGDRELLEQFCIQISELSA